MSTYKRLWGILPLAIIFVIALCGAFAVMPQLARADDPDNPEANQTTEVVDGEKEEPSGSSESKDAVEPEPSKSSDSGASSSSSGSSASSSSSDSGASSSSSGSEASKETPSENKSDDPDQKSTSSDEKKTSVKKQDDEVGYGIWVQGVQVKSSNASDVLGNKTVVYDNDKKTLTLKSAKLKYGESVLEGKPIAAISVSRTDGLTIVLEGDSSIVDGESFDADSVAGLYVGGSGKVTFEGEGTLTLDVKNTASSVDNVSVYGICSDGGAIEIGRKTKVKANAGAAKGSGKSIGVKGSVKVSSLAVLTAIGQDQALNSTPDIKDSTIKGALVNKEAKEDGRSIWDGKQSLASSEAKYVRIPGANHTAAKAPTCTTDGNIEYWYDEVEGKYYSDSSLTTEVAKEKCELAKLGHSWDKGKVTKAATATKNGVRTYTCTRCKATKTEKIPKTGIKYTLTAGANGTWTKGTQSTLNFTFKRSALENNQDTTFKHFTGIKVDNKAVDKSNYTYQSGSVVIKLKPTYLEKLSTGTHTISASFNDYDGKAPSTSFTVKANSSNTKGNSTTPKTGDQIQVVGWVIAGIVAAIIAVIAFRRMRRTDK